MGKVLLNGRVRSFIPVAEVEQSAPVRRQPAAVPVLREDVLGVKFSEYLGLPPEIHNQITGMLPELLRHLYQPLQEAFRSGMESKLESVVTDVIPAVVRWLGCALTGMLFSHHRGFLGTYINCGVQTDDGRACNERLEYQREQRNTVKTMLGEVTYTRSYYHGSCGHSAVPLDSLVGIDSTRILPNLEEEIALLSADMPYEHAVKAIVRWTGMSMSKHTAEIVTQNLSGELLEEQEAERVAAFDTSLTLPKGEAPPGKVGFVSVDGGFCKIVGQEEESEFKLSVIGSFDPTCNRRQESPAKPPLRVHAEECVPECESASGDGKQSAKSKLLPAPTVLGKRYIGRFEDAETFIQRCTVEFHKAGLAQVQTVFAATDGAEWIVNRLPSLALEHQEFFHLLDWWHTDERLGELSKAVFGEDEFSRITWLEKTSSYLWDDKLPQFFGALTRQLEAAKERKLDELVENLTGQYEYFRKRRHMLRYKEALERGFIIGSGIMEGGIRFAGKDRLCRTGMKWCHWGAEEVLALRCLWASGLWTQFQQRRQVSRLADYKRRKDVWTTPKAKAA
jgi:hypothetical protein